MLSKTLYTLFCDIQDNGRIYENSEILFPYYSNEKNIFIDANEKQIHIYIDGKEVKTPDNLGFYTNTKYYLEKRYLSKMRYLKNGANIKIKNVNGKTPYYVAKGRSKEYLSKTMKD